MANILSWDLSPKDQKQKNKKVLTFLLSSLPIFIGIVFTVLRTSRSPYSVDEYWSVSFYAVLIILISFIINSFSSYPKRSYELDDSGITISKGKKRKHYFWNDFSYFYQYSMGRSKLKPSRYMSKENIESFHEADELIRGHVFYLRKKPRNLFSKLYKEFVIVYVAPSKVDLINTSLTNHLKSKPINLSSDLGLVIYRFK